MSYIQHLYRYIFFHVYVFMYDLLCERKTTEEFHLESAPDALDALVMETLFSEKALFCQKASPS